MSPRTLHRRLAEAGTTYSRQVEQCRLQAARRLLAFSEAKMYEIAKSLGYADPSSFSRAFFRWTGMTPREYRAESRDEHGAPRRPKNRGSARAAYHVTKVLDRS